MKKSKGTKQKETVNLLVAGKFCKCYHCDVDNQYCKKYELTRWDIGDYTWENHCLKNGGCDK